MGTLKAIKDNRVEKALADMSEFAKSATLITDRSVTSHVYTSNGKRKNPKDVRLIVHQSRFPSTSTFEYLVDVPH
jgi:hypothetical protein